MFKKTVIAATMAGIAAFAFAGNAQAHKVGQKHKHVDGVVVYKTNKKAKNKNKNITVYKAPKKYYGEKRHPRKLAHKNFDRYDYNYRPRPKHRNKGYFGPGWGGLPPYVIRQTLRARGYRKIQFRDRHLPLYVVKACKRGKRFQVGLNRWGKIMWKKPRGYCRPRTANYWY